MPSNQARVAGIEIANAPQEQTGRTNENFQSKLKLILACLGCVVGTGNIWRFPRIVANNSGNEGGLVFLIVWVIFLFLWSVPMLTLEYTLGRRTGKAVVGSFLQLGSSWTLWCGAWVCMVSFLISCYYAVILGWCVYYCFYFIFHELPNPDSQERGREIFKEFAEDSNWPILTTAGSLLLAGLSVVKGVKTIEKVSQVLVPILLLIVLFTFIWSLTRDYAGVGLTYLFTPDWASFSNPRVWIDALSQNAFDTGAGSGLMVSYSTFMANYGVVRYAHFIPAANNVVSLISGMTLFAAVFSSMILLRPYETNQGIIDIMKDSGPGSTGLTFIWLPVLFETFGVLGRVVTVLFFLCLSFAGLTSLIANMELFTHTIVDFGLRRSIAMPLVVIATFLIGLPSAMNLDILTNQDFVWGFGLVVNGMMFAGLIIYFGVSKYVEGVNRYNPPDLNRDSHYSDWKLYRAWGWFMKFLAIPLGTLLLVWWIIDLIDSGDDSENEWYELGVDTFMVTLLEWIVLLLILWTANAIYYYAKHRHPGDDGETTRLLGLHHYDNMHQTSLKQRAL